MVKSILYCTVASFDPWKEAYDALIEERKAAGERLYSVGILFNQPEQVFIINGWNSVEQVEAFVSNQTILSAFTAAGMQGDLRYHILLEVENGIHE